MTELQKFQQNIFEKFKPLLSIRQINSVGQNTTLNRYETAEIISALQIRYSSPRSYKILKTFLPIPSIATLKRWASKIECQPGIQNLILDILKQKCIKMDNREKLCVIVFDEIEISKKISYMNDQILGPFSKCQVALLRGLCSNWKQPIFLILILIFRKIHF